jgi:hypothetical protein
MRKSRAAESARQPADVDEAEQTLVCLFGCAKNGSRQRIRKMFDAAFWGSGTRPYLPLCSAQIRC